MKFLKCLAYLTIVGAVSFILGRILPKKWFKGEKFPYRSYAWEKEGRIYEKIKIKAWQNRVPDMSRIFPKLMPKKCLDLADRVDLPRMVHETCVAEFIHLLLCVVSAYCLWLWPGAGGAAVTVVYILANLAFVFIQRYNRPRLIRLRDRMARRGAAPVVS